MKKRPREAPVARRTGEGGPAGRPSKGARKRAKARLARAADPVDDAAGAPPAPLARGEADAPRARRPDRYAFAVDEADHAETPRLAYAHLAPLLDAIGGALSPPRARAELRIWDPFFCAGSVVAHLRALGFKQVHNVNEDFYERVRTGELPSFDVLVTNPPYTADHVPRLLAFCARLSRPSCLLLPSYVYMKEFYGRPYGEAGPCYLAPPCRYKYRSPPGAHNAAGERRKAGSGSSGVVTSPFTSFWYLKLGADATAALRAWWAAEAGAAARAGPLAGCVLALSAAELPHAMRDASDPSRKRLSAGEKAQQLAAKRAPDGRRLCTACGQVWGNCRHTKALES